MKNNDLRGFKDIYDFTISQTFKSKSFRGYTIVLCLIALLSMPVLELLTNGVDNTPTSSDITKVYVIDETGLPEIDYNVIKEENPRYRDVLFEYTDKSIEDIEEEIREEPNGTILMHVTNGNEAYDLKFVRSPEGSVSEVEISEFALPVYDAFQINMVKNAGVTEEQMAKLEEPIRTDIQIYTGITDIQTNTGMDKETESQFNVNYGEYGIVLVGLTFVIIMIQYGGQSIASSIVTEKSTKLIEILLTSVRPMAIIVGKVFAMLTVTLLQVLSIALCFGVSCIIYKNVFNSSSYLPDVITSAIDPNVIQNLSIINIIMTIIIYILGFIFYGFLAGLTGATVSKVEELQEGMVMYSFLTVVGAYMAIGLIAMGLNGSVPIAYGYLTLLLPISSVFVTPMYLLLGKLELSIALLAIIILFISTLILINFTAKVYQTLILHQGNPIKTKDLISMSKTRKEAR